MRANHNIRQALCISQQGFATLLQVSLSLVSLEELDMRNYPSAASDKANKLLMAFLEAEPEITLPKSENYISKLKAKMENQVSFQITFGKQERLLERKLQKAKQAILKLGIERKKLFEKFEDLWKAHEFLKKHLPTVTDEHDKKYLENALVIVGHNLKKPGLRLMQIDTDLLSYHAAEKALETGLARLRDSGTEELPS